MRILIVSLRMDSLRCIWLHVRVHFNIEKIFVNNRVFFSLFPEENHLEVVKFLLANGANQSLATEVSRRLFDIKHD